MNLQELREASLKLQHETRTVMTDAETARTKGDESRAAELDAQADKMFAEVDRLERDIQRNEKLDKLEKAYGETDLSRRPVEDRAADAQSGKTAEERYAEAFIANIRGRTTGEQRGLLEQRAQSVGTNSEGGYTVPTTVSSKLVEALKYFGPMVNSDIVDVLFTSDGRPLNFPTNDETANVGELLDENTAATDDALVFGSASVNAFTYSSKLFTVSNQLLQDSVVDVGAYVMKKMAERIGRIVNQHLTTGTGTAQPKGIVTAATVGKTAASATAIAADELIDLQMSVNQAYRGNAAWQMNSKTFGAIRKLKDSYGQYLWAPGLQASAPVTLLGHPVYINDDMADIATGAKTVLFGDFKAYTVRRAGDAVLSRLNERFAEKNAVGFVGFQRFGGNLLDTTAVKVLVQA